MMKDRLIYVNGIKAIKQSEYLEAINRAKNRMDNKNTFFVKQLQDEIAREKWEKDFWYNKYKNLKNKIDRSKQD